MPYADKQRQADAQRAHYERNKERFALRIVQRRGLVRRFVIALKDGQPCADCGVSYPHYVLQYDHVNDDKTDSINRLVRNASLATVQAEIAKCELVCANCHAKRTWARSRSSVWDVA